MHILLINNYFPPEIGAASHLYYYLGKEFLKRGHKVTVLTGIPRYNVSKKLYESYSSKNNLVENIEGLNVIRTKLPLVNRSSKIKRGIEHFEIARKLAKQGKNQIPRNIDVSLVYSPPLTLYKTAYKLGKRFGFSFVLNVQDIFPQNAIDLGMIKNKILVKFFKRIEKKAYRLSNIITVHSENNANILNKEYSNITASKLHVVENFIDTEFVKPGSKKNPYSKKHNLIEEFVVSFAGTLGYSQDMDVIIEAAKRLKKTNIKFLIVGDGVKHNLVKKTKYDFDLNNLIVLPSVPKEVYPQVLNSSDISLVTLTEDVNTPVVPSKILSIMSAGIPVLATMNLDGDAPKLINKAKAGYVFPAGDSKSLADAILRLYNDRELREKLGKNGRKYVEENLSAKAAAEKYEKLFQRVIDNKKRRKNQWKNT